LLIVAEIEEILLAGIGRASMSEEIRREHLIRAHNVAIRIPLDRLTDDPDVLVDMSTWLPTSHLTVHTPLGVIVVWRLDEWQPWIVIERLAIRVASVFGGEMVWKMPNPTRYPGVGVININKKAVHTIAQFRGALDKLITAAVVNVLDGDATHTASRVHQTTTSLSNPFKSASEVKAEAVDWLWPGIIPRGSVTLLAGQPGTGKSQIAVSIASIITGNGTWPTGQKCPQGRAIIIEAEDAGSRIRSRIDAAGGRPEFVSIRDADDDVLDLSQPESINMIAQRAEAMGGIDLLVISPLLAHFRGGSSEDGKVRERLEPLRKWASDTKTAVLAITHPPKGSGVKSAAKSLDDQFAGAEAHRRAARAAFAVIVDMNDPEPNFKSKRRLMICVKQNDGPDDVVVPYRIEGVNLPGGIPTSRVMWLEETNSTGTDRIPVGTQEDSCRNPRIDVDDWLTRVVSRGPKTRADIMDEAERWGIPERTVYNAKVRLGILGDREGRESQWRLP
jgi:putative DNA primase/helicase